MSFREILRGIVEECGGGIGAALMGSDGVPIEEVVRERLPEGPLSEGISVAGVEFQRILDDIRKASNGLEAGALEETVVVLDRMSLVFRPVDPETFLVVVLDPNGNLGKARYLMRKQLLALRQML
ncbi:MAG: hypothetical protein VCB99_12535 [Myxococcota bacterium]